MPWDMSRRTGKVYRMSGDIDYMLRIVVPDIARYDALYKRLIATVSLCLIVR